MFEQLGVDDGRGRAGQTPALSCHSEWQSYLLAQIANDKHINVSVLMLEYRWRDVNAEYISGIAAGQRLYC